MLDDGLEDGEKKDKKKKFIKGVGQEFTKKRRRK